MHSILWRLNAPFFFGVIVLGILTGINVISTYFVDYRVDTSIQNIHVNKFINNSRFHWEEAELSFDLKGDFSEVFNWNVNYIYIYVELDYESPMRNAIIIWDKIIPRFYYKPLKIEYKSEKGKYTLKNKGYNLRGKNVLAKIKLEIEPIAGFIFKIEGSHSNITFPTNYSY
ncbi:unnamed protein product [Blepharisma stoltei]|uniref:Signal peptidase complex subunit 3 n=1 Tax=Blepharisma stoltei TaxID=1481888 RepID=A0AAU9JE59_9CILI|nr:unnamed protein product [Blepharisma stoltei]